MPDLHSNNLDNLSPSLCMKFLWPDGTTVKAELVAIGRTGVIVKRGDRALKIPRKVDVSDCVESKRKYFTAMAEISHESREHEKCVYRRLDRYDGIVECFGISDTGIEMALLKNGDLTDYIQRKPDKSLQLAWIRQMASTIQYVHGKHVIIADIATRNFLITDDLSIKLCDFTESSIIPLDVNMDEADDSGYSVQTDIGQFGPVIYEVVTGKSYSFDLFQGQDDDAMFPRFPSEQDLPMTENIWLGSIIRKCWRRGGYRNMDELCRDLSRVTLD